MARDISPELLHEIGLASQGPTASHPIDASQESDLVLATDQRSNPILLAVEHAPPVGTHALEGAIARGWLRLRACLRPRTGLAGRRLVVLIVTRAMGAKARTQLDEFVATTIGPDLGWIVVDGKRELGRSRNLEPIGENVAEPPAGKAMLPHRRGGIGNPFTDGMLCCVKALIHRESGLGFGRIPSAGRDANPHDAIAAAADVSRMQVNRFLRSFEAHGFVRRRRDRIDLVRRAELFTRFAERLIPAYRRATRAMPKSGAVEDWLDHPSRSSGWSEYGRNENPNLRFALGAHRAAEFHGVHEVVGAPICLHFEGDIHELAEALDLVLEPRDEGRIQLVPTPFPAAVFRFATRRREQDWPVVDVLQAWIDSRFHPTRGSELAAEIARRFPKVFDDPKEKT